jgi:hypothetical protein
MLPAVVDRLGAGGVMYASDYPHWDGAWPNSSGKLLSQPLESSALAAVAGDNARRFYSLPGV